MLLVMGLGLALATATAVEGVPNEKPMAGASSAMSVEPMRKVAVEPPADAFATQTWQLFELQAGPDVAPIQPTALITLQFDAAAGRVSGSGGCNRYFAGATVRNQMLTVFAIGATRMACPPPAMAEESAYFAALERATGYQIEDGVLTLTLADGGWLRYRKLLD